MSQGWRTVPAHTVREALIKMDRQKFTHILCELDMEPEKSAEVFAAVSPPALNKETKLTLMTKDILSKVPGLIEGRIHKVLVKPFSVGDINEVLKTLAPSAPKGRA